MIRAVARALLALRDRTTRAYGRRAPFCELCDVQGARMREVAQDMEDAAEHLGDWGESETRRQLHRALTEAARRLREVA